MSVIDAVKVALSMCLVAGPVMAQQGDQGPSQVFTVRTTGPAAVAGRADLELQGIAFPVSQDMLLTASGAVGAPEDFGALVRFRQGSVPNRTTNLVQRGDGALSFTTGVAQSLGPVAALIRNGQRPPLAPLPLSACAVGDAPLRVQADAPIVLAPIMSGGIVTHYRVTQPGGWNARAFLGAPVLSDNGHVVGMLTDAAEDGSNVAVTLVGAFMGLLPEGVILECDPRIRASDISDLSDQVTELGNWVADMRNTVKVQDHRIEVNDQALNLVIGAMADVADELQELKIIGAGNQDIAPILGRISDKLKPAVPLVNTVSDIAAYLQRPTTWKTKAKVEKGVLKLTFSYQSQLPGPPFSPSLKLCMRIVTPFQGTRTSDQYFRTAAFYAAVRKEDETLMVQCSLVPVNVKDPDGPTDSGEYRHETWRIDLEGQFKAYSQDKNWIPADHEWSGLLYVALMKPATGSGSGSDTQADAVIQRALIRLPPRQRGGDAARAVECRTFESDQEIVDYLAQEAPGPPSEISPVGFDDVSSLQLDPVNKSDECVLASAQ